jgi:hypothetical protein
LRLARRERATLNDGRMMNLRSSVVVVGCVFVGFLASAGPGLVARAAEPDRWVEKLTASGESAFSSDVFTTDDQAARRRITELERQVKQLEAERGAAAPALTASSDLDAAIARNRELVERNRALSAQNQALAQSHVFDPPVPACEAPRDGADAKAQLRYWADQLRNPSKGFRGKLTPAQNSALNVLLQEERTLDPHNPWRDAK